MNNTFSSIHFQFNTLALFLMVAGLITFSVPALAQESQPDSPAERQQKRQELRDNLSDIENEIQRQQTQLEKTREKRQSLERDVKILEGEIRESQLQVEKKNTQINQLTSQIRQKREQIDNLNARINDLKASLAELVRKRAQVEDVSFVEVALSNQSISEFFKDLDSVQSINTAMQTSFAELRQAKSKTKKQKTALANQKSQVASARQAIKLEQNKIKKKEAQKEQLAQAARSEEATKEDVIKSKQKKAQRIRNQLFALRDTGAIPFGRALRYARSVSEVVGVRPAFLLAILKQESALGRNVGTCNRPQDPPSKQWDKIMKPSRDIEPYKQIVAELGLEPDSRPLSCPFGNGWGGAMGPAQFIPSTWAKYQSRIANAVGVETPNPWNPQHAFMASGVLLRDHGASSGRYQDERRAALKYYAGRNWRDPSVQFYGDQVMQKAQAIQTTQIDPIEAAE